MELNYSKSPAPASAKAHGKKKRKRHSSQDADSNSDSSDDSDVADIGDQGSEDEYSDEEEYCKLVSGGSFCVSSQASYLCLLVCCGVDFDTCPGLTSPVEGSA